MSDKIMIIDEKDCNIGYEEKQYVHQNNILHRAFSLIIYDENNEYMLIQKRASDKYHSGGLWTNACCSHFTKDDENKMKEDIIKERTNHELKIIINNKIQFLFKFHYNVKFLNNIYENEIDYLYKTHVNININIFNYNKNEVSDIKWMKVSDLQKDILINRNHYTEWFQKIMYLISI